MKFSKSELFWLIFAGVTLVLSFVALWSVR